jgi:hypothetical protein
VSISFFSTRFEGSETFCSAGDLNMSNRNASIVMAAVGFPDEPCGEMPIDTVIHLCRNYLRARIGKPSAALPTNVDGNFWDCGLPEGYVNQRVHQLVLLASEGKERGATHITWS